MRRSKKFFLFSAILPLLASASAQAAEHFVSLSGNDANPGTLAAPFRTISRAAKVAQPGDVVNVRGGVYSDAVSISSKGTPSARIVFREMPGEEVILDGSSIPAGNNPIVSLVNAESVDVVGFEVRNSGYIGIVGWHVRNVRILDNHIHHATKNGIYVGGDTTPSCSDITVSGNRVHDTVLENQNRTFTSGGWSAAVVVSRTERATITRNRIFNNDGEGLITLRSTGALIQQNEISDNFSAYIYLDNARFVTVDSNLVYSTGNTRYYRDGRPGAGIAVANETKDVMNPSSDNTIINNIVVGTRWGFYYGNFESGGGLKNTKVMNNTFYGTTEEIIRVDDDAHANSVVQNNIFRPTVSRDPRYSGAGKGVVYANNLWYGGNAGVAAGTGDVYGDPMFARPGGFTAADYRIGTGSPAVARAADVTAVLTVDHFGTQRLAPLDIGAHEVSSAAAGDGIAPSIPGNLRTAGGDAASIVIAWDAASDNVGVAGYTVIRNGATVANVTTTSWTDRTVTERTLYTYQVVAYDAAGNRSAGSVALTVAWSSTGANTPAPPTPAKLEGKATSSSNIELGWSAATDADGVAKYRVYRNNALIATTTQLWFSDGGLQASTAYTYQVDAVDANGEVSSSSNAIVVTTKAASKSRAVRR